MTDCLETLEEIAIAGRETFLEAGGESYRQIPCLNDQAPYIDFLAGRVERGGCESAAMNEAAESASPSAAGRGARAHRR